MTPPRRGALLVLLAALLAPPVRAGEAESAPPAGRTHDLSAEDRARVERMRMAAQEARRRLGLAHEQALQDEKLRALLEEVRAATEAEMVRLAPEKETAIRRRYEVYAELIRLQKHEEVSQENASRVSELTVDYEALNRELGLLPKQALATEDVRRKSATYNAALLAKMTEIEPDVPKLLELQKQLVAEFDEYREKMTARHGTTSLQAELVAPATK